LKSGASGEEDTALLLMRSLAKARRRVKGVFAAVHGEGLVWFNVVPNLNNDEQDFARKECAGLVRQLSTESRAFAFSAALAAELFPNLASRLSPDQPLGVHIGVLYKVVQAAAPDTLNHTFHSLKIQLCSGRILVLRASVILQTCEKRFLSTRVRQRALRAFTKRRQ
jgi:hypothetical protein